jgi:hypothetical protein
MADAGKSGNGEWAMLPDPRRVDPHVVDFRPQEDVQETGQVSD